MPLSLTCSCGVRLDIDDKFAGQVIHCPDCNRALDTGDPPPIPTRTSGYALASLLLALAGAFTLVGTIAAIVCGTVGLVHVRKAPERLGGRRMAQAGILLGAVFTLLTLAVLSNSELVRLDGILRALEWVGKVKYTSSATIAIDRNDGLELGPAASINRPSSSWGQLTFKEHDNLVLVNLWEDAYILCINKWLDGGQTLEACRQEAEEQFLHSDLITRVLSRARAGSPPIAVQDRASRRLPGTDTQEFFLDMRLDGVDRTFLVRVLRNGSWLHVVAGGTRKNRFARLERDIVSALDSYRAEQ